MAARRTDLNLYTLYQTPLGWPLQQVRIPQAHAITCGAPEVVVAVIDLGYRFHPHHQGHLWVNPSPVRGDVHGWDCHDEDASLEDSLQPAGNDYYTDHHAFVAGEVMACAPQCRVMVVRVGYQNPASWWRGVEYAVAHGARILVIPHGFLTHEEGSPDPLFYRSTDFSYPVDNPLLRQALEAAYQEGCLIFKGTADNRGRRVAAADAAIRAVIAVGSSNREGEPSDICCSADYVEVAAPGGQRSGPEDMDPIWSTGGRGDYVSFTGGGMASGFAGGVAALVMSRFPDLSNHQLRQVLRNTARGEGWNPKLGWGILDAERAVGLAPEVLAQRLKVVAEACRLQRSGERLSLEVVLENQGAFDIEEALVTVFNGDPARAAAPQGSMQHPVILMTRQLGHGVGRVRGLHRTAIQVDLIEAPAEQVWVQGYTLDLGGSPAVDTVRIPLT